MPLNNRINRLSRGSPTWLGIVVAVALFLLVNFYYVTHTVAGLDFSSFWSAGTWLAMGRDPYSLNFLYPIWFAIFFIPFNHLPFLAGSILWLTLNQICVVTAVCLTHRASALNLSRPKMVATSVVMLIIPPTLFGFYLQQPTGLFLLLLVGVALAWQRERVFLAGIFTALLLAKPQLMLVIVVFWLALATMRGKWRHLIGFCVTLLGLLMISEWAQPGWAGRWLHTWPGAMATPLSLVAAAGLIITLIGVGIALALFTMVNDSPSSFWLGLSLVTIMAVMLNAHPITYYYLALLALPLTWLVTRQPGHRFTALLLTILVVGYGLLWLSDITGMAVFRQSFGVRVLMVILYLERAQLRQLLERWQALLKTRPLSQWPITHIKALSKRRYGPH